MFLNPERVSLPDIDVDISHERRDEVIAYVRQTYGHVAQIATYSLLHPKSAVRDICRVLDLSYSYADMLSKLVPEKMPDQSEVTLEKFLLPVNDFDKAAEKWGPAEAKAIKAQAEQFLKEAQKHPEIMNILHKIEGCVRSVGIHAGGVLIAPTELTDYCSLIASPGKVVCSLDMEDVDVYGLLKVDLLGLKTVSIIYRTAERVGVDIDSVPLDDPAVYELYQNGQTHGIFQLSGDGITRYAKEVKPREFSDLVDILALA